MLDLIMSPQWGSECNVIYVNNDSDPFLEAQAILP